MPHGSKNTLQMPSCCCQHPRKLCLISWELQYLMVITAFLCALVLHHCHRDACAFGSTLRLIQCVRHALLVKLPLIHRGNLNQLACAYFAVTPAVCDRFTTRTVSNLTGVNANAPFLAAGRIRRLTSGMLAVIRHADFATGCQPVHRNLSQAPFEPSVFFHPTSLLACC